MKKNLMLALLALCFVMMASSAFAAQACGNAGVVGSLLFGGAVNTNSGGSGAGTGTSINCDAGGLNFNNFQYLTAGGTGPSEIDLVSVTIGPGAWVLLNFNPNLSSPSLVTDLHFTFSVNGVVFGTEVANFGFLSGIQENNCAGAANTGLADCSGVHIFSASENDNNSSQCVGVTATSPSPLAPGTVAGSTTTCAFNLAGQNGISVWKDINLSSLSGHQSSFTEGFLGSVPEPMTFSLMGAGLLGLGLLRRRMAK